MSSSKDILSIQTLNGYMIGSTDNLWIVSGPNGMEAFDGVIASAVSSLVGELNSLRKEVEDRRQDEVDSKGPW
jgi:hypothetical protein